MPTAPGPCLATDREQQRLLVAQQRAEIRRLEPRIEELERQLRRRTIWLSVAVIFVTLTGVTVGVQILFGNPFAYLTGVALRLLAGL